MVPLYWFWNFRPELERLFLHCLLILLTRTEEARSSTENWAKNAQKHTTTHTVQPLFWKGGTCTKYYYILHAHTFFLKLLLAIFISYVWAFWASLLVAELIGLYYVLVRSNGLPPPVRSFSGPRHLLPLLSHHCCYPISQGRRYREKWWW